MKLGDSEFALATAAGAHLHNAAKSIRILRSLAWDDDLATEFLNSARIPEPQYNTVDISECLEEVGKAQEKLGQDHVVFAWLARLARSIELTAHMLANRGTTAFHELSAELYGIPTETLMDGKTRVIDMARHMDQALDGLDHEKLVMTGYEEQLSSGEFAKRLKPKLRKHFGSSAPKIKIVPSLSAKAVAGSTRIRLRKSAIFSNRDVLQLLQHEALIHTATSLNGRAQRNFPILGRAHAYTTEIQEGLAVFAEIVSGAMDPIRFRRLSDRVLAIQMSIEGADFKEVFDFYVPRSASREQAFENTRRIFRGGVMTGGAPFTKDMVYLNGLLRVHNFMRTVVSLGRADLIRLLFVGKLDIEDVPALAQMASVGRLDAPIFLPPWAKDLRFLVSYMGYSSFLNQVKLPGFQTYYQDLLGEVPDIWAFAN